MKRTRPSKHDGRKDSTLSHAGSAAVLVPRASTLDGFVDSAADGVCLDDLDPLTTLVVGTRNSSYRIVVSGNGSIHVQGGRFFPTLTTAHLDGSSTGGSLLKVASICVGMRMEISSNGLRVITSPVRVISKERDVPPSRTH